MNFGAPPDSSFLFREKINKMGTNEQFPLYTNFYLSKKSIFPGRAY